MKNFITKCMALVLCLVICNTAYADKWQFVSDLKSPKRLPGHCTYYRLKITSPYVHTYIYANGLKQGMHGYGSVEKEWLRFDATLADLVVLNQIGSLSFENATTVRTANLNSLEIVATNWAPHADPMGVGLSLTYFAHSPTEPMGFAGKTFKMPLPTLRGSSVILEGLCEAAGMSSYGY